MKDFFERLQASDIKSWAGRTIFQRGKEYLDEGRVFEVLINSQNHITSEVEGNYGNYHVEIQLKNMHVRGYCECPYFQDNSALCKHIVAVLLYCSSNVENLDFNVSFVEEKNQILREDLEKLSKEELIQIILKGEHKKRVEISLEKAENIFNHSVKNIKKLLHNENYWHEPRKFEAILQKHLNAMRPAWKLKEHQIAQFLLYLMQKIESLQEEGYLYTEEWYNEEYFEGTLFRNYVLEFLQGVSFENKIAWIEEYEIFADSISYSTFYFDEDIKMAFTEADIQPLKEYIDKCLKNDKQSSFFTHYYQIVEPILSAKEKSEYLGKIYLKDAYLTQKYLELFNNNPQEQIKILRNFINKNSLLHTPDLMIRQYANLLRENQDAKRLQDLFNDIIRNSFVHLQNIEWLLEVFPQQKDLLKNTFKNINLHDYMDFLIQKDYFEEALQVVVEILSQHTNTSNDKEVIENFLKYYKSRLPEMAKKYYLKEIEANLVAASQVNYIRIVTYLEELYEIDSKLVWDKIDMIKKLYKRRTRLIEEIAQLENRIKHKK
ncbi:MAG: SWIM zinc finger family protein [Raineya sp.]|nr:SWIM zinc finger family protein [Raineya sp.]MDW8295683.1 SWIM zinc finger family protein [Raineya sp.]